MRHQERPVYISTCPLNTELLCPLDTFEMIFESFSYNNCRFDEWCKEKKIFPKENNKYLQKSYSVGARRENLLKEEKEAKKKEAERNKGTADEEQEKDYRRITSTGNIEHEKTLEKELMTEAKDSKTSQRESSEKAGQQVEKSKEKGTNEEEISEAKDKHALTKKKLLQEMKPIEETEDEDQSEQEDVKKKESRTSRFWAEYGDDSES